MERPSFWKYRETGAGNRDFEEKSVHSGQIE